MDPARFAVQAALRGTQNGALGAENRIRRRVGSGPERFFGVRNDVLGPHREKTKNLKPSFAEQDGRELDKQTGHREATRSDTPSTKSTRQVGHQSSKQKH